MKKSVIFTLSYVLVMPISSMASDVDAYIEDLEAKGTYRGLAPLHKACWQQQHREEFEKLKAEKAMQQQLEVAHQAQIAAQQEEHARQVLAAQQAHQAQIAAQQEHHAQIILGLNQQISAERTIVTQLTETIATIQGNLDKLNTTLIQSNAEKGVYEGLLADEQKKTTQNQDLINFYVGNVAAKKILLATTLQALKKAEKDLVIKEKELGCAHERIALQEAQIKRIKEAL